jgi:hypothetical protein
MVRAAEKIGEEALIKLARNRRCEGISIVVGFEEEKNSILGVEKKRLLDSLPLKYFYIQIGGFNVLYRM